MPRVIPVNDLTTASLDQDTDALPGTGFAREEIEAAVLALKDILDGYQGEVLYSSPDPGATENDLAKKDVTNQFSIIQKIQSADEGWWLQPSFENGPFVPVRFNNGPSNLMKYRITVDGGMSGAFRLERSDGATILLGRPDSNVLDLRPGRPYYNNAALAFFDEMPADTRFSVDQAFNTFNFTASFTVSTGFANKFWGVSGVRAVDGTDRSYRYVARAGDGIATSGFGGPSWSSLPYPGRPATPGANEIAVFFIGDQDGTISYSMNLWAINRN